MAYYFEQKILVSMILLLFSQVALSSPTVKVTLKVVDEAGKPVKDARAAVNFAAGTEGNRDIEKTDSDGLATFSGSSTRFIEYGADKAGYYRTANKKSYTDFTGITGFRRWLPWNETLTVILKRIKNPRALYIGNHDGVRAGDPLLLPGTGKEYGYDLIAQDWTAPDGIGTHKDFVFMLTGKSTGYREYDYTLGLSFTNDGDGIQQYDVDTIYGSKLRLPHEAPIVSYKNKLIQRKARTFNQLITEDFPNNRNYFFRVRTKKDKKGNIVSALYGKIHGNISFLYDHSIHMLYYLNPDSNDRNLESDYKKNLFPANHYPGHLEYPP